MVVAVVTVIAAATVEAVPGFRDAPTAASSQGPSTAEPAARASASEAAPAPPVDSASDTAAQRDEDTPTPLTAPASPPPARRFTVAVTGDVLTHEPILRAARRSDGTYDFTPLLSGVRRPIASADLALCHLEVPLTRDRSAVSSYPSFNAPAQLAHALAAVGYDGCSVASNHAMDRGADGIVATLRALDRAGLGHAGTARSAREARRVTTYDVDGAQVAHLSYTYGLNGISVPADRPWLVELIDRRRIVADARRARRRGADVVLVSLHWGSEYVHAPTDAQRTLARRLLASPAIDALIGHHAHVVQPVERMRGKVVVYGLGNHLSNQAPGATPNCCVAAAQDGVIVRLTFRQRADGRWRVGAVDHLPTIVQHPQRRVVLVDRALRRADGAWEAQLRASRQRTRRVLGPNAPPAR